MHLSISPPEIHIHLPAKKQAQNQTAQEVKFSSISRSSIRIPSLVNTILTYFALPRFLYGLVYRKDNLVRSIH
jgi:hypothetical protein